VGYLPSNLQALCAKCEGEIIFYIFNLNKKDGHFCNSAVLSPIFRKGDRAGIGYKNVRYRPI
jgi:hypothetical protein